jgi:hypothetical protein
MSATTVELLRAASEIVGGDRELADRFGIAESLLDRFLADSMELPVPMLLRAVDIILDARAAPQPLPIQPTVQFLHVAGGGGE